MPDKDEFQQWVDELTGPEMLSIVYACRRGIQNCLTLTQSDLAHLLRDVAYEGHIHTGTNYALMLRRVLREGLLGYFERHRADCEEELQPRYNGPPVEQASRDARKQEILADVKFLQDWRGD